MYMMSSFAYWPQRSKIPLHIKRLVHYSGSRRQDSHYSLEHKCKLIGKGQAGPAHHHPAAPCTGKRAPLLWLARTWPSDRCAPATLGIPLLRQTRHVPASGPLHLPRVPSQASLTECHTLTQLACPYPLVSYSKVSSTGRPISLFSYVRIKLIM